MTSKMPQKLEFLNWKKMLNIGRILYENSHEVGEFEWADAHSEYGEPQDLEVPAFSAPISPLHNSSFFKKIQTHFFCYFASFFPGIELPEFPPKMVRT